MILPSKHLHPDRALLTIGAKLLKKLARPKTVSALWEDLNGLHADRAGGISYEWYILSLDLLFIMGAIELRGGLVTRSDA